MQKATDAKQISERAEAKEQAQIDIMAWITDKTANHQDASLDDSKVKDILTGKSYVKEAKASSFITAKGEYEIPYSELYEISKNNLAPGLYDENGSLIKTWQELKDEHNIIVYTEFGELSGNPGDNGTRTLEGILVIDSEVTCIKEDTFLHVSGLKGIILPDSLTEIEANAFRYCSGLEEIDIPNGVKTIGESAFEGCTNLTQINIPSSVKNIEEFAFLNCESITEIDIPNGVETIGNRVFAGCVNLNKINIPESVLNISESAFYIRSNDDSGITTINIAKNFEEIAGEPWATPVSSENFIEEVYSSNEIGNRGIIVNWMDGQVQYFKFYYNADSGK